ncbi:MAG: hypothetical protein M1819_003128 [Sarea resinae]|nr:MAG: hypothetical protein M1819_003128 [Sarea resinae]
MSSQKTTWISNLKERPSNPRQGTTSHSPTTEPGSSISCELHDQAVSFDGSEPLDESNTFVPEPTSTEPLSSQAESADVLLTRWSDQIFHRGFETIFGLLVGRNGCPLVNDSFSDVCIPATKLFRKLDAERDRDLDRQNSGYASEVWERRQDRDYQIEQTLSRAIRSFAAPWLPLVLQQSHLATSQIEEIIRDSWRTARGDMLKVINRVSYRSALTLYLFAQTPIPVGVSEDEELDGINGLLCLQTALLQIQRLREGQRSCQFDASEAGTWTDAGTRRRASLTQAYLDLESRAYWAAVMWDTSSSLTLNLRTSLTSGLNGGCSEPAWRLARTFLAGSLQPETEYWRTNGLEVSDEVTSKITTAAAVCKLYVWKNITSLKEALREGVDEESVLFVWKALLDSIDIFRTSIRPLLNICERRLQFMDQLSRLSWYEFNLQYYLGILVLVNAIEAANRSDLLSQLTEARQDAEHESFNVLKFGIESTYTLYGPGEDSNPASRLDATSDLPGEPITLSFVAIDPYPNHVVDSVLLLNEVISREYRQCKIKHGAYSHLWSTLTKALGQLPQSSKAVQAAQENLQRSFYKIDATAVTNTAVRAL